MGGWDKNLKRAVGVSKDQKDQIDVCCVSTTIYWRVGVASSCPPNKTLAICTQTAKKKQTKKKQPLGLDETERVHVLLS